METNDLLDLGMSTHSAKLSTADKEYMQIAAKWAKFLAIVYFIFEGLLVIVALAMIGGASAFGSLMGGMYGAGFGAAIGGFYLIFIGLAILPTLYLYRFATKTQEALRTSNDDYLTEGFKNLSSMFKFLGVMMAVILGFYAIIIILAIIGGIFSRR